MIFVGEGGLLQNAIDFARKANVRIDMVYSPTNDLAAFCTKNHVSFAQIADINEKVSEIAYLSEDKAIFSINNAWIFKKDILSLPGFRFYNIHSGIIPAYRGKPEVCIIFALLNRENEYGVCLHEIDENIDTGRCIAAKKFPITADNTFEDVMVKCLQSCEEIFSENLTKIINNEISSTVITQNTVSKLYSYKDLGSLIRYKTNPFYGKATDFGLFELWFPKAQALIKQL